MGPWYCGPMQTAAGWDWALCLSLRDLRASYDDGAIVLGRWLRAADGDLRRALDGYACGWAGLRRGCRGYGAAVLRTARRWGVSKRDPIATLTQGIPGQWSADYVHGLLPAGWRLVHGPSALPDLVGGAVLNVGADGPRGEHAGYRLAVSSERLIAEGETGERFVQAVLSELGDGLRQACEKAAQS